MLGRTFRLWIKDSLKYVNKDPFLARGKFAVLEFRVLQTVLILKEMISPIDVPVLAE